MDVKGKGWESVGWIHLDPDRGRQRALVNMAMNFGLHTFLRNFLVAKQLLAHERLSSMELICYLGHCSFHIPASSSFTIILTLQCIRL
jgi:hypothetical protein